MSEIAIAVITGCIGIIGTAVGSLITSNLHFFNVAAQNFIIAFSNIRIKIEDEAITTPSELIAILERELPTHKIAVTQFRFFLPKGKIAAFNKAWKNYYDWDTRGQEGEVLPHEPCFEKHFINPTGDGHISSNDRQELLIKLDNLLSFAKFKKIIKWTF